MEEHAVDLMKMSLWVISGLGTVIALLLGAIFALAKWAIGKLIQRLDAHELTMTQIKDLLQSETRLLRDTIVAVKERVAKLEEFRAFVQETIRAGRRSSDVGVKD